MSDDNAGQEDVANLSPSSEDIRKWEQQNDVVHPAFRVEHRPERSSINASGCLWGNCNSDDGVVVTARSTDGEQKRSRVCQEHLNELQSRPGVSVEVNNAE